MAEKKVKYFNMIIHLIRNNRLYEENVAIRNIWEKDKNIFVDIYFYSQKKSYVIDGAFIHDLLDLSNDRYYKNISKFLQEFNSEDTTREETKEKIPDKKIFEKIYPDLVMLSFIAGTNKNYTVLKQNIIVEYAKENLATAETLSKQFIISYLQDIQADETAFFKALQQIVRKKPEDAVSLLEEMLKVALSDGQLQYTEKRYLAEVVQILREEGVTPNVGL